MFGRTKDPVCGMKLMKRFARVRTGYSGKMYYFCSVACKARFEQEPERWLQKRVPHEAHISSHSHR